MPAIPRQKASASIPVPGSASCSMKRASEAAIRSPALSTVPAIALLLLRGAVLRQRSPGNSSGENVAADAIDAGDSGQLHRDPQLGFDDREHLGDPGAASRRQRERPGAAQHDPLRPKSEHAKHVEPGTDAP